MGLTSNTQLISILQWDPPLLSKYKIQHLSERQSLNQWKRKEESSYKNNSFNSCTGSFWCMFFYAETFQIIIDTI